MYTLVHLTGACENTIIEHPNRNHRYVYRATLRCIDKNIVVEGANKTELVEVKHTRKDCTKLTIRLDGRHYININIKTFPD